MCLVVDCTVADDSGNDEVAEDLQGTDVDHEASSLHLSNGFDMSENTAEVTVCR